MTARRLIVSGAALAMLPLFPFPGPPDAAASGPAPAREVFFDDFSGSEVDRGKWRIEVTGENFGTVNSEQQSYVDSPETMYIDHDDAGTGASNGALALHPRFKPGTQAPDGQTYDFVSGRLSTQDKFEFTYGSYAARLKLPEGATGSGLWPAWWSLGADIDNGKPWPQCGEVDVMENVGEPWTNVSLHGPEYNGDTPIHQRQHFEGMDPADWHVYRVDWNAEGFTFFVDDREIYRITKQQMQQNGWSWVFDDPQFMILNFALGGTYPSAVNGVTEPYLGIPQETVDKVAAGGVRYLVDWVRVEQQ
ncbi:glycosyl hydrolase family 16 [Saccharopolyspora erythraea NRRL 2338]|uniref:Secreted protein n=2 Tax=Saccharopolyspora erythraea TaxID=1836 RepID=A4FP91_SACEN|nr:glycoside hydrolase family 16 protein [Saccharopolyspora erythraea]EQD86669.1 hypothetical protein N599_08160 [Saccharopolyspora erythraea D]PFG99507.1 glycosyl hydrolase family 16 [Saccharopolyspora erythraea NRRL 2338]QRK89411.1 glycoside hydrolase family 16 protein [Saccharopolyspora erythraea]CAM05866.1 secreted protein [Saccharopolyspora erythraea NRRL 2338]